MLILNTGCYNKIIREAIEKYPRECCGFLIGRENGEQRIISGVVACTNSAGNKEKEFMILSDEYRKAEKEAEDKKCSLLGVYHSHPDWDAVPSATDAENDLPNFSYLIVSVFKSKVSKARSWQLNNQLLFEEETILNNQNTISKNNSAHGNYHYSDSLTQVHR